VADADTPDTQEDVPLYSFDGKGDFVGWPDAPEPDNVDGPDGLLGSDSSVVPDGSAQPDAAQPDSAVADSAVADTLVPADGVIGPDSLGDSGSTGDTGTTADTGATADSGSVPDSTGEPDVPVGPDAIVADLVVTQDSAEDAVIPTDNGPLPDTFVPDATSPDSGGADVDDADVPVSDVPVPDTTLPDSILVTDGTGQPDGATEPDSGVVVDGYTPDWQGYPDTSFPPDADIYAGAIGSCLQLYLYQQESCGKNNPTAQCIDSVALDGSLYAQFLYEPLRLCENAVCVPQCQNSADPDCFERCVGKSCAAQFFGCTANAASASNTCATTFECAQKYEDKFLTISAKCYAAATTQAQQQFVSVISCTVQPQTESCVQELATCYGAGPNGTSTCSAVASCAQGCGDSEPCVWQCMSSGTPKAIGLIDDWWDCLVQVCGPKCGNDQACSDQCGQSECLPPLLACLSD
jgi:hypothetical protein